MGFGSESFSLVAAGKLMLFCWVSLMTDTYLVTLVMVCPHWKTWGLSWLLLLCFGDCIGSSGLSEARAQGEPIEIIFTKLGDSTDVIKLQLIV